MQQEPERILRIRTVLARSGLSRSTLYRKMEKGTFPKQLRISEYCAGWRESELNRWIADPPGWRPMPATVPEAHSSVAVEAPTLPFMG